MSSDIAALQSAAVDTADAVFPYDYRGMRSATRLLPDDAYGRAARAICEQAPGTALLVTGFPVNGTGETDGPPGTRALARALTALGWRVTAVACPPTRAVVTAALDGVAPVEVVDVASPEQAGDACRELLRSHDPALVVVVERPGLTQDGRLVDMRGEPLDSEALPLDALVEAPLSIAIGDGGNEIGMGAIADHLTQHSIVAAPCVTRTTHLLLASVSNWGAYGLASMLELQTGLNVAPAEADDARWLRAVVRAGAVDGVNGERRPTVDTLQLDRTAAVLARLREIREHYAPASIAERATP